MLFIDTQIKTDRREGYLYLGGKGGGFLLMLCDDDAILTPIK